MTGTTTAGVPSECTTVAAMFQSCVFVVSQVRVAPQVVLNFSAPTPLIDPTFAHAALAWRIFAEGGRILVVNFLTESDLLL